MRKLEISADPASLAQNVGTALVRRLGEIQTEGREPSLVLTGGTIALEVYRAAAVTDPGDLDWSRVDFWWGDERYVPADSSDRNDRAAGLALLDHVGVDPMRVHAMPAADEAHQDVSVAAASYGELLRTHGTGMFDVVLLGLGPDGHVASLFPGFPQLEGEDIALPVTNSPKPPPVRITLGFPTLNRTREVWFLVSGEEKADAVARALADTGSITETPARGITCDDTTWWLDQAAAHSLPPR